MTVALSGKEVGKEVTEHFHDCVLSSDDTSIIVVPEHLFEVAEFLKNSHFAFDYLVNLTSVDYLNYLEVVYNLVSLEHNHSVTLKVRCHDRDNPTVQSVVALWKGADLQEREVYDLMGIGFDGHPNLKRIVLWEGFQGHPLRKDYL